MRESRLNRRQFLGWLWIGCLASCAGCGTHDSNKIVVTGDVSLDGLPIDQGDVIFLPTDGDIPPDAGKIVDGKFKFRASPGKKRVEIHASRPGPPDPEMGSATRVDYIPARYNSKSTLTAEVSADSGHNNFTFTLHAK